MNWFRLRQKSVDSQYSSHHYQRDKKWKQCRRRAAIEPIIYHLKSDYRMVRNYLKGAQYADGCCRLESKTMVIGHFLGSSFPDENCRLCKFFDGKRSSCLILSLLTRRFLKLLIQNSDWCSFSGSTMYKISSKLWMRWKKGLSNYPSSKTRPPAVEFFIASPPSLPEEFTYRCYLNILFAVVVWTACLMVSLFCNILFLLS